MTPIISKKLIATSLKELPRVSIIIVVKNDRGIERTLELITLQKASVSTETIVIDASQPGKLLDIRLKYPLVRWEQYDQKGKRFTITEQRNRGIDLAKGEIIVFIDASCAPTTVWLRSLIEVIDSGEDIVAGPCLPSNPNNLVNYIPGHPVRKYVEECTTVNVALRKAVVERTGYFDTKLDYGEDVDFFWRAIDAGFKISSEPKAVITHDFGEAKEQRIRAYRYGKSRAVIHAKHWRTRWYKLLRYESHVWIYPVFILSLPIAFYWPQYLLVLFIPLIKNRSIGVILHHLIYGCGVLVGVAGVIELSIFRRIKVNVVHTG